MVSIRKIIIALLLFSFGFFSCEDVIEVELKNVESQLVIQASLFDKFQPATVILSKTSDFFDTLSFNTVSDAEITISDNAGNTVRIPETDTAGIYRQAFFGEVGKTYTLNIKIGGKTYSSQAEMKPPIAIDSLICTYDLDPFLGKDSIFMLSCFLRDSAQFSQYAKLDLIQNQTPSRRIYLFDDTYTDGNNFEYKFFNQEFEEHDTLAVIISSCDPTVYDYLYTYAEITDNFFHDSGTPYNPTSNISGGALGYFGVFSLSAAFTVAEK